MQFVHFPYAIDDLESLDCAEMSTKSLARESGNNHATPKLDRLGGAVSAASGTLVTPQESSVKRGTGRFTLMFFNKVRAFTS